MGVEQSAVYVVTVWRREQFCEWGGGQLRGGFLMFIIQVGFDRIMSLNQLHKLIWCDVEKKNSSADIEWPRKIDLLGKSRTPTA